MWRYSTKEKYARIRADYNSNALRHSKVEAEQYETKHSQKELENRRCWEGLEKDEQKQQKDVI